MKKGYLKSKVLEEICKGDVVSGGLLAAKLGISRTAVWKAVNSLRAEGYFISGGFGGYVLGPENTRLCGEQFSSVIKNARVIFREETGSTNEDIKAIADSADEFTVVVARRQTGGKGRLGRAFYSPEGGLYFSVLLRPQIPAEATLKITT
ncbi:MAG: HTH domain-containing protein, partial [Clostridia bacterium]|nr:HTH domain-containing protein [Clostridia bacterium]